MGIAYRRLLILAILAAGAFPEAMAEEPASAKTNMTAQAASSSMSSNMPSGMPATLPPAVLPTAPTVQSSAASSASGTGIPPLRNIDLLNKMEDERLPTSPRHFLKVRFKQVRRAKDQKILQLLLVCVGFVGAFVAILALRSVPPSRPPSS